MGEIPSISHLTILAPNQGYMLIMQSTLFRHPVPDEMPHTAYSKLPSGPIKKADRSVKWVNSELKKLLDPNSTDPRRLWRITPDLLQTDQNKLFEILRIFNCSDFSKKSAKAAMDALKSQLKWLADHESDPIERVLRVNSALSYVASFGVVHTSELINYSHALLKNDSKWLTGQADILLAKMQDKAKYGPNEISQMFSLLCRASDNSPESEKVLFLTASKIWALYGPSVAVNRDVAYLGKMLFQRLRSRADIREVVGLFFSPERADQINKFYILNMKSDELMEDFRLVISNPGLPLANLSSLSTQIGKYFKLFTFKSYRVREEPQVVGMDESGRFELDGFPANRVYSQKSLDLILNYLNSTGGSLRYLDYIQKRIEHVYASFALRPYELDKSEQMGVKSDALSLSGIRATRLHVFPGRYNQWTRTANVDTVKGWDHGTVNHEIAHNRPRNLFMLSSGLDEIMTSLVGGSGYESAVEIFRRELSKIKDPAEKKKIMDALFCCWIGVKMDLGSLILAEDFIKRSGVSAEVRRLIQETEDDAEKNKTK